MTTPARRVLPGQTHFVTRRCSERRLFLLPDAQVNAIVGFAIALAATRYSIDLHALFVHTNHWHAVLTDRHGKLPKFMGLVHSLVARALNARMGRTQEAFWAPGPYNNVEINDWETLLDKLTYTYSQAVKDGLVASPEKWTGLHSSPEDIGAPGRSIARPSSAFFGGSRPSGDRRRRRKKRSLPTKATLQFKRPPRRLFRGSSARLRQELRAAVDARVRWFRCDRVERGLRHYVGMRAVLAQDRFSSPTVSRVTRRVVRQPAVASKLREARIAYLRALVVWRAKYREKLAAWRKGKRGVLFPAGTYRMHDLHRARRRRSHLAA